MCMNVFQRMIPVFLTLLLLSACNKYKETNPDLTKQEPRTKAPYLVVVSLDGFRWDYADRMNTPNLDYIAEHGVKAEYMQPSFPTVTFPNHYTLATGLYPNNHGLIFNHFYAPDLGGIRYSSKDAKSVVNPDFYGGEPGWNTAEKHNIKSAVFFWPGSEAPINGMRPSYYKTYDKSFPFEQRIDTVAYWLQLPEKQRPHLIYLYFSEPDASGHTFGPYSPQVEQAVEMMDGLMGKLMKEISTLPIAEKVNLIIVSDHGMSEMSKDRWQVLTDEVKPEWVKEVNGSNPAMSLFAEEGCVDSIYMALGNFEHLSYWKSDDVPERLEFGTNVRRGDIVLVADSSWSVSYDRTTPPKNGAHGFDNKNPEMRAIFYAIGPAFKEGYSQPHFRNVSLYPLVSKVMKMGSAPNDGRIQEVKDMLK